MLNPHLWPDTARLEAGQLWVGGAALPALAAAYATPLYILDMVTLRGAMRAYRHALARHYPAPSRVHYASKALFNIAVAQVAQQEGLGLDLVSAAELLVARRAGVDMTSIHLHGNAKSDAELHRALDWGVGAVVVDNLDELERLIALSAGRPQPQPVLVRVAPDIAAHTHAHIATGAADAKFGLPLAALPVAVERILAAPGLHLRGLHAHIGSQIFELGQLAATVQVLVAALAQIRAQYGVTLEELSPGGGLGVPYTDAMPATDIDGYAQALAAATQQACAAHNFPLPLLTVEPGRSIIARAGVALYRVVARKFAADGRLLYLHVDGGMADNIRPALYAARYTALLANRADAPPATPVNVAGRYCESGDILLRDAPLPAAQVGDVLAVAGAGAYTLSMASTYNMSPRPALLLLNAGQVQVIQRRETEEDLLARDLPLV